MVALLSGTSRWVGGLCLFGVCTCRCFEERPSSGGLSSLCIAKHRYCVLAEGVGLFSLFDEVVRQKAKSPFSKIAHDSEELSESETVMMPVQPTFNTRTLTLTLILLMHIK